MDGGLACGQDHLLHLGLLLLFAKSNPEKSNTQCFHMKRLENKPFNTYFFALRK
jgi:hypothetical protein